MVQWGFFTLMEGIMWEVILCIKYVQKRVFKVSLVVMPIGTWMLRVTQSALPLHCSNGAPAGLLPCNWYLISCCCICVRMLNFGIISCSDSDQFFISTLWKPLLSLTNTIPWWLHLFRSISSEVTLLWVLIYAGFRLRVFVLFLARDDGGLWDKQCWH